METNKDIEKGIDRIIDSIDTVNVSPFFKDKTMKRLFSEKEQEQTVFAWFTPKLQLATLAAIVILNLFVFSNFDATTNDDTIDEFGDTYALNTDIESSIFN